MTSEWMYPYISYFGQNFQCHFNVSNTRPIAKVAGYVGLPSNRLQPVLQAVASQGPLAVAVDASAWSEYESGVFNGCNQTNPDIDHAVQLVGYGTDPVYGDYWIIRNSWSPLWGEQGYIRIARETGTPTCGTDIHPQDGTECKGGPPTQTVCGTCGVLFDVTYPIIGK
jgi:cathepsin L